MTQPLLTNKTLKLALATILVIGIVEAVSMIWTKGGYEVRELVFYLRCLAIIVLLALWGFRAKREWIKNLTLAFVSMAALLFVIDCIFFIVIVIQTPSISVVTLPHPSTFSVADNDLGYVPVADTSIRVQVKYDTVKVYDIRFTTDKYHRRIYATDTGRLINKYALFFGCSVTFGEGLNDSETIPARFAQFLPDYHAYNFGFSGYGTQQMLANLQKKDIEKEITEKTGAGFYIFINPHINRAIGDMQVYDAWGAPMPYYYEKGDTLIRNGSFKTGRKFVSGMYTILGRSSLLKYFKVNFPLYIKDRHYKLVTKMIKESYNQYVTKFHNNNFYVVIFPGESLEIVPFLREQNLKVLDYSKLFERNSKENSYLPYDSHPRPIADRIFARQLSTDIKKLIP